MYSVILSITILLYNFVKRFYAHGSNISFDSIQISFTMKSKLHIDRGAGGLIFFLKITKIRYVREFMTPVFV